MNFAPTAFKSRSIILRSDQATHVVNEGSCNFDLDEVIFVPNNCVALISVQSATIPMTMYLINSETNSLILGAQTFVLSDGNYTIQSLINELNTQFIGSGFLAAYSSKTNRVTLSRISAPFLISHESTCLQILGFQISASQTASNTHEGSSVVDISGVKNILIRAINLNTNTTHSSGKGSSIIARVPLQGHQIDGGIEQFIPSSPVRMLLNDYVIDRFHLVLQDEDIKGSNIHFNGIPWTVHLLVDIVFKPRPPKRDDMLFFEKSLRRLKEDDLRAASTRKEDKQNWTSNRKDRKDRK